jgi:hypothetical protein
MDYYAPGVRDQYPSVAYRGPGAGMAERPAPPAPTSHRPGTPGKVAELARRAAAELSLWHQDDGGYATPTRSGHERQG